MAVTSRHNRHDRTPTQNCEQELSDTIRQVVLAPVLSRLVLKKVVWMLRLHWG